jgi:hypothetical protein
MPPESQAPIQQCSDCDNGHAAEYKNREIRHTKHNTVLICGMLTYNTIEMFADERMGPIQVI